MPRAHVSPRPLVQRALLGAALLACALGCGPQQASAPANGTGPAEPPGEGATPVHDTPADDARPTPAPAAELPANLHVVVFFQTPRGREHLDVRVITDASSTYISGVRADETRAHPVTQRVTLSADERAEYGRLIAAIGAMPRCEPLARFPDEPTWQVDSERYNDSGPSLWFRENGAVMLRSTDPCLAYVRLAHFVYATWERHLGI